MNDVTDLSPLAEVKALKDLNVSMLDLEHMDLSVLDELELERFWCHRSKVSEEQKERFIAANPETLCSFYYGHSTSNGWRESYRYKQFRTMFKNRTWTDFVRPEGN